MTRPIVWALGTAVLISLSAVGAAEKIAARFGIGAEPATLSEAGASLPVVNVSADLRGHFVVHPVVEGRRVRMMVDTGASVVALTYEDARTIGLNIAPNAFTRSLSTANGTVEAAPVRIAELKVGTITVRGVDAVVLPAGRLGMSLLGMTFLRRLGGFEIARGQLTLRG